MSPEFLTGLLMAALLLVAGALATRPWWRGALLKPQNRRAANVAAYRLRLAELEAETAAGLIPADEAAALHTELEARVLADASASEAEPDAKLERRPLAVLIVGALLAMFAVAWYGSGGSWRVQREIAQAPTEAAPPKLDPKIEAMVAKLAGQLSKAPDDPQGWAMLGRSYLAMQRYGDAANSYGEANARSKEPNAEWLTDEGEAIAFAEGRAVQGRAAELFERALALAPNYGKALWYGGLASVQAGDFGTARARWQLLLREKDLPDAMRTALEDRLKSMDELPAVAVGPPPASAGPGATANEQAIAPGAALRIKVSLAPELAAKVPAGAILFVFAKAESGPPIPLAVQRLPGAKLPMEVKLDDSMAMAPALKLSQFERYVLTARLSAAGGAQAQSGDLEGKLGASRAQVGGAPLALTIDRVVP